MTTTPECAKIKISYNGWRERDEGKKVHEYKCIAVVEVSKRPLLEEWRNIIQK